MSNIGDISVLNFEENPTSRNAIHARYILVALNMPAKNGREIFRNFHAEGGRARDYKLRTAFLGTEIWGAYMTDILKDFPGVNANAVRANVIGNPEALKESFKKFNEEVSILGAQESKFIAFGGLTAQLLRQALPADAKIKKVLHYSYFIGEEDYRERVLAEIGIN